MPTGNLDALIGIRTAQSLIASGIFAVATTVISEDLIEIGFMILDLELVSKVCGGAMIDYFCGGKS